jgi:hypothetical protein
MNLWELGNQLTEYCVEEFKYVCLYQNITNGKKKKIFYRDEWPALVTLPSEN